MSSSTLRRHRIYWLIAGRCLALLSACGGGTDMSSTVGSGSGAPRSTGGSISGSSPSACSASTCGAAASNTVDFTADTVQVAPTLVASVVPTDTKQIRVRGSLASATAAQNDFVLNVQPFHDTSATVTIGGLPPSAFNFSGAGTSTASDVSPAAYVVNTGTFAQTGASNSFRSGRSTWTAPRSRRRRQSCPAALPRTGRFRTDNFNSLATFVSALSTVLNGTTAVLTWRPPASTTMRRTRSRQAESSFF